MTPRFLLFIPLLIQLETVYRPDGSVVTEHDPDDDGGATRYGIDQASHPHIDIDALTLADAEGIYFAEWTRINTEALPARIGELLFDIHVNGGPGALWLQRALCIEADGFIGPKTLAAAASLDGYGVQAVVKAICVQREGRYTRLAEENPRFAKFLQGWLNRSSQVRAFCLEPIDPDQSFA